MNELQFEADWERFARMVAEVSGVPLGKIAPDSRLVGDLDLDSLALTEIVVALIERYAPLALIDDLERQEWEQMTAGALYRECTRASSE